MTVMEAREFLREIARAINKNKDENNIASIGAPSLFSAVLIVF